MFISDLHVSCSIWTYADQIAAAAAAAAAATAALCDGGQGALQLNEFLCAEGAGSAADLVPVFIEDLDSAIWIDMYLVLHGLEQLAQLLEFVPTFAAAPHSASWA